MKKYMGGDWSALDFDELINLIDWLIITILTHSYLSSWYIQIINTCELVPSTVTLMLH